MNQPSKTRFSSSSGLSATRKLTHFQEFCTQDEDQEELVNFPVHQKLVYIRFWIALGEGVRLNRCRVIPGEQMMTPGEVRQGFLKSPRPNLRKF